MLLRWATPLFSNAWHKIHNTHNQSHHIDWTKKTTCHYLPFWMNLEISRKHQGMTRKKRETFPFLWSIFQSTYPFTDGRIVAVPLWYPLHHWHHGLQVPLAPRWCHLHCTCLRPWRNGDGNNGNCLFIDTADETNSQNHHRFGESFDEMAICLCENIWRGVLFVHVGKYLSWHLWCVVIFCKHFAAITEVTPLLSRCTFTSFAYRESVKTPRAVVAQV